MPSNYYNPAQNARDRKKYQTKKKIEKQVHKNGWVDSREEEEIIDEEEVIVQSTPKYIDMEYMKNIATMDDITRAYQQTFILAAKRQITPFEMNEFMKGFEKYSKHLHSYEIMEKYYLELKEYKSMYAKLANDKKFDIKELTAP